MIKLFKMIVLGSVVFTVIISSFIFSKGQIPKNSIINTYDRTLTFLGKDILTSNRRLKGIRYFGIDNYCRNLWGKL